MSTKEKILHNLKSIDSRFLGNNLRRNYSKFKNYPAGIHIDISGTCNLRCKMCSLEDWYPKDMNIYISEKVLSKIYQILPKIMSISLMNNCEPLVNKNIVNIVKKMRDINNGLHIGFVTNGMLLNEKLSAEMIDLQVNNIVFSLDGATAKTNDKIRVGGKFDKIITNIKKLNKLKKVKNSRLPKISILSVSSKENVYELADILQLTCELGADSLTINGLEPYDSEMENQKLWGETITPEYEKIFEQLKLISKDKGIELRLPSLNVKPYHFCNIMLESVIDANGDVYPCSPLSYRRKYYYRGEENYYPRISFGNLNEKSFDEIWFSEKYNTFRTNLLKGNFPEYCKKCLLKHQVTCV
jgi:radical SAM protein with 4Fe4S-binding SPASM domain